MFSSSLPERLVSHACANHCGPVARLMFAQSSSPSLTVADKQEPSRHKSFFLRPADVASIIVAFVARSGRRLVSLHRNARENPLNNTIGKKNSACVRIRTQFSSQHEATTREGWMRTLVHTGALCLAVAAAIGCRLSGLELTSDWALVAPAHAQAVPKSLEQSGVSETAIKDKKNENTVGVAGGLLSGTYMTFADELAQVLDDGDNLRVLPVVTYGAASNLDDLLYLRGIDVAVTQSDVFEYFRTQRKTRNLESRVQYIIRLPVSEMHVLARNDIKSIEDLRGKKVNFGPAGSASSLTGSIVFQRLGVQVEQVLYDNPTALQKVKSGEVAALVRVIGKPIDFFNKIPPESSLRLVSIPFSKAFADYYTN